MFFAAAGHGGGRGCPAGQTMKNEAPLVQAADGKCQHPSPLQVLVLVLLSAGQEVVHPFHPHQVRLVEGVARELQGLHGRVGEQPSRYGLRRRGAAGAVVQNKIKESAASMIFLAC